jgi:hypothetical protein
VIAPEIGAGIYSNIVRIQGNTLCQNINVSSIFTSTISTNILTTQFILGAGPIAGTSVYTNTLLPNGSSGIGNTGNNFYTQGCFASTFTSVIQPRTDAGVSAVNSNVIRINGFISTQSLGISTINFKAYPFVSTLNNPVATADASVAGTAVLTRIQSNTLSFPRAGTYKVFQEYSISKGSGGGIHGSLIYASNGATTATVANATNWPLMGMSSCPFQDTAGVSTLTTAVASILVNSGNLTRDLYYFDSGSGNYTASFYINPPTISYIPTVGISPEV